MVSGRSKHLAQSLRWGSSRTAYATERINTFPFTRLVSQLGTVLRNVYFLSGGMKYFCNQCDRRFYSKVTFEKIAFATKTTSLNLNNYYKLYEYYQKSLTIDLTLCCHNSFNFHWLCCRQLSECFLIINSFLVQHLNIDIGFDLLSGAIKVS